jgi:branched chain amino acid efflux pump
MNGGDGLAGPWGAALAIFCMMIATLLCRVSGFVLMSRIRITPRIERALRALPGSIVIATIVPIAAQGGASAVLGIGVTVLAMSLMRLELIAVFAGLATIAAARAFGF